MDRLNHYMCEMEYYLSEINDIPDGTVYSSVFNVVTTNDDVDDVYKIAYQLLLEEIISSYNLRERCNKVIIDEFEPYELAAQMVSMIVGNVYTCNGNVIEVHD